MLCEALLHPQVTFLVCTGYGVRALRAGHSDSAGSFVCVLGFLGSLLPPDGECQ
jgi:hypothetical protein